MVWHSKLKACNRCCTCQFLDRIPLKRIRSALFTAMSCFIGTGCHKVGAVGKRLLLAAHSIHYAADLYPERLASLVAFQVKPPDLLGSINRRTVPMMLDRG
jgi:hypothetical protein